MILMQIIILCPATVEGNIAVLPYVTGLTHWYTSCLQVQGKLWEMTSAWTEEMERIHAAMRELVCRRYRFTHIDTAHSMLHNRPQPLCCLLLESMSCLVAPPVVGPHDAS